jgi:hypothetical protein
MGGEVFMFLVFIIRIAPSSSADATPTIIGKRVMGYMVDIMLVNSVVFFCFNSLNLVCVVCSEMWLLGWFLAAWWLSMCFVCLEVALLEEVAS